MPSQLTIFGAEYLVFVEAAIAALAIVITLRGKSRVDWLRWGVAAILILGLSFVLARAGAVVFNDPRPFTEDHVQPLISHAADNGFPSDHALLAASLVALVALADLWAAIPFAFVAFLVDWARVGTGVHHVVDVLGSVLFVALATLVALGAGPWIVRLIAPRAPAWLGISGQPTPQPSDKSG